MDLFKDCTWWLCPLVECLCRKGYERPQFHRGLDSLPHPLSRFPFNTRLHCRCIFLCIRLLSHFRSGSPHIPSSSSSSLFSLLLLLLFFPTFSYTCFCIPSSYSSTFSSFIVYSFFFPFSSCPAFVFPPFSPIFFHPSYLLILIQLLLPPLSSTSHSPIISFIFMSYPYTL